MATNELSQENAFNSGSDLWILPPLEVSHWTASLDWYLNFQICKSSRHIAAQSSEFLNDVVRMTELEQFKLSISSKAPLMISTELLLPNKWVVIVPWNDNLAIWTSAIYKIWSDLKEPRLRIFLPPGQNSGTFQKAWIRLHSVQDFTVVLD